MKVLGIFYLFCFLSNNIFFNQKKYIHKFHTINLKKGELIQLYTERIREITIVLPFLALTNEANMKLLE